MNWQDLRFLLAIARGGTLSAAARALGVNQTTVARRLARVENDLGTRIFDRIDGRCIATDAGEIVLARGEKIEQEFAALETAAGNMDQALTGAVRLTAVQGLITRFFVPRLSEFLDQHPRIELELIGESGNLNLSRREADIAVRLNRPVDGDLVIRRIGEIGFAIYATPNCWSAAQGDLGKLPWLLYDESLAHLPEARWVKKYSGSARRVLSTGDSLSLLEAAERGLGAAALPCHLGDTSCRLQRVTPGTPIVTREIWLLTHRELQHVARIRCLLDWIVETVQAEQILLSGTRS